MDHDGIYPAELVKELGRIGLIGVFAPQEYGGAGLDLVSYIIALEEISKVWASLGTIMATEIDGARLLVYRAAELKQKGLPFKRMASQAKLFSSEVAARATTQAIQIHVHAVESIGRAAENHAVNLLKL